MKKIIIPILVALLTLFVVGCQSHIVGDSVTGGVVAPISYGEIMEEPLGDQMVSVREFTITVNKEGYHPNTLQVNKDETVRLIMYPSDTDHGFVLPAYGINEHLEENNYKTIEFVADMDGEYRFFSNVYSGPNTKNMYGTLIVAEEE
ncbi:hypothetical protein COV16_04420 [Candidatus Woesearchaeota archaeon CG10_big_fil_rev_8_21_14_0_10_34_8]|nr:MAG: hypothetical protein COV16_04420 [Candidatus Woesearchaeota archaeon CG10_big_fil_rev_8_21_14_0_10_34_8]